MSGIEAISAIGTSQAYKPSTTEIKNLLAQLGLQSTGSEEGDWSAIKSAIDAKHAEHTQAQSAERSQKGKGEAPAQGVSPYSSILQQLGITQTGTIDGDLQAINAKLAEMSASATTEEQKAKVSSIQASLGNLTEQLNSVPFQKDADQTASLNKHFMNKQ